MKTSSQTNELRAPGYKALFILLGISLFGLAVFYTLGNNAAIVGWLGSSVMGLFGWWTTRKAFTGDQKVFMKYVLGGMTIRFFLYGLFAGLMVGLKVVEANGFIVGLLSGIAIFLAVEVVSLYLAARHASLENEPII
jgi:hypothetical protein